MCLSEEQWEEVIAETHGKYTKQPDNGDGVARYTVEVPAPTQRPGAYCKNGHYAGGWPPSTVTCRICGEMLGERK